MIITAPPASDSVYDREKLFWYHKISFSNHVCLCGAVVKEFLARADKLGSTPGDAAFCFFVPFFSLFGLFFNTIFSFGLFFFILTADPAGHALGSIYIFKLKVSALANFQHFILPPKSFYRKFRWCNMHIWCSFFNIPSHLRYLHRQILRIFASFLVVILRIISICHHIDSIPQFLRN